jgi:methyl-accepting chemotaxis protein
MGTASSAAEEAKNEFLGQLKNAIGFSNMKELVDRLLDDFIDIDTASRNVAKSFGQGSEFLNQIKASLSDSVKGVMQLGGNWEKVVELQKDYSDSLGRNVLLSSDLSKELYAAQSVMGEDASSMLNTFKNIGYDARNAMKGMQDILDAARSIGVSAEKTTTAVMNNMSYMNKVTFQGGVVGMAKMAAQAVI